MRELNQASHQSLKNSVHEILELRNKLNELLFEESAEKMSKIKRNQQKQLRQL